ncbi:hypothetical protein [Kitasatospora camelliae]|uniref:Uncharacterized protein n=1 Tax=Kitasatospora camelliae TaxID=3156397 RepID=A0AAU8JZF6_9ACTN
MGRRVRTTKVQIPRQRGRRQTSAHVIDLGRGTQPLVVVVPHRPSPAGRLALAVGGALWRHRVAWAPSWAGGGIFLTTGVLSAIAPAAGIGFAVPAVLVPAGWFAAKRWHPRSAVRRRARDLRTQVLASSAALAWVGAACLFGPVNWPLFTLWLLGTGAAQAAWWRTRCGLTTKPIQP